MDKEFHDIVTNGLMDVIKKGNDLIEEQAFEGYPPNPFQSGLLIIKAYLLGMEMPEEEDWSDDSKY